MRMESRSFTGAKEVELSPGCTYFEHYGHSNVTIQRDMKNPGRFVITMPANKWAERASKYIASNGYPPVV